MVLSLLGDVGLPVVAYFVAGLLGAGTYVSLLAGIVVSAVRMSWVGIRERRLDAFATFLVVLFGAGFVLTFVTGDVRFVLAKDAATSATAGLIFLGSCLVNRPLAYYAAKRFAGAAGSAEFVVSADTPAMRKRWYTVSLFWGLGLLTDAALRVVCIYQLDPDIAAGLSQGLTITAYAVLITWTVYTAGKSAEFNAATAPPGVTPAGAGPPIRLLVVENDVRVRAAIRDTVALEADLHIVGEAGGAPGAYALADTRHPAVALVDVLIPDAATGLALVGALNRRLRCAVVAMSVQSGLRDAALAAGAAAFVDKGGDIDAILAAVRAADRNWS